MKTKNIFLTLALALCTTFAFAQISGTAHDFSAEVWNLSNDMGGEICNACHTPHQGSLTAAAPLWSRVEAATFSPYASATFDADERRVYSDDMVTHNGMVDGMTMDEALEARRYADRAVSRLKRDGAHYGWEV